MDHDNYSDTYIRGILNTVKTIAMVGVSANTSRPSYFAFKYLMERGYRMIPVNPGQAGKKILGQKVYAKLADIPEPVDMVDIFRASQFVLPMDEDALALTVRPSVIWMQLGIRNDETAKLAEGNGLKVAGSLSEDRVRTALVGDRLDGRQYAHAVFQESAAFRPRHPAHGPQSHHPGGRRHRRSASCRKG
jgi:predicted CoA-binding protein